MLDAVADHHEEFIVTKRGRPVARLVPIDSAARLEGSVEILIDDDDALFSTGEAWVADAP